MSQISIICGVIFCVCFFMVFGGFWMVFGGFPFTFDPRAVDRVGKCRRFPSFVVLFFVCVFLWFLVVFGWFLVVFLSPLTRELSTELENVADFTADFNMLPYMANWAPENSAVGRIGKCHRFRSRKKSICEQFVQNRTFRYF